MESVITASGASPSTPAPARRSGGPWTSLLALRESLDLALAAIAGVGAAGGARAADTARDALAGVIAGAAELRRLCALDADAMLAAPLRLVDGRWTVRHAISSAIVVERMLTRLGASDATRRSTVQAALTMNVGMFALHELLWSHVGALSTEQRAGVIAHPRVGVSMLRAAGVDDPPWLAIVGQHHEQRDGRGYPAKLAGDSVRIESQALMVADRWCALVAPRAYRVGAPPDRALPWLLGRLDAAAEPALGRLLAQEVGALPPGSGVRLASGEHAVVVRRTDDPDAPRVRVVRGADGRACTDSRWRDTTDPRFRVEGCVRDDALGGPVDPRAVWDVDGSAGSSA